MKYDATGQSIRQLQVKFRKGCVRMNPLSSLHLSNFTVFSKLDIDFSQGTNVFIGANSTGKTHVLKLLYAAANVTLPPLNHNKVAFPLKVLRVFMPAKHHAGRLVRFGASQTKVQVCRGQNSVTLRLSKDNGGVFSLRNMQEQNWFSEPLEAVFIPPKEMLTHAPGFVSLTETREIHFDETYPDLIRKASVPILRKKRLDGSFQLALDKLSASIGGKVMIKDGQYFRQKGEHDLEFDLLAEGYRKLGLLWLLIRNGMISTNSVLFWDEPEANLNPKMIGVLVEILLQLQRAGVQIFLATHNYVILKEFDLRKQSCDNLRFFSFFFKKGEKIGVEIADDIDAVDPNLIVETFVELYDRDVDQVLEKGVKD